MAKFLISFILLTTFCVPLSASQETEVKYSFAGATSLKKKWFQRYFNFFRRSVNQYLIQEKGCSKANVLMKSTGNWGFWSESFPISFEVVAKCSGIADFEVSEYNPNDAKIHVVHDDGSTEEAYFSFLYHTEWAKKKIRKKSRAVRKAIEGLESSTEIDCPNIEAEIKTKSKGLIWDSVRISVLAMCKDVSQVLISDVYKNKIKFVMKMHNGTKKKITVRF